VNRVIRTAFVLFLIALHLPADGRRRPLGLYLGDGESQRWLARNAFVLRSLEYPSPSNDLEPLRAIVGQSQIVALADATHGTHEFFTVKLRMIDFLVREMGFDVVAFEAPFTTGNRLNEYVQGGGGDPRAILADADQRLYYRFWNVEEMLAVVEWMRAYNANRGPRPAVVLAGFDTMDQDGAEEAVTAYLGATDPAAADEARREYDCVPASVECQRRAAGVRDRLASRRGELSAVTGAAAFDDALHHAAVVVQSYAFPYRDEGMAGNVAWVKSHRGTTGRMVLWAHQEHAGKTESEWVPGKRSMGWHLSRQFGGDYVVIGSLTGEGMFSLWEQIPGTIEFRSLTVSVPPIAPGSYEERFAAGPANALLLPLRGVLPAWLRAPAPFFSIGQGPGPQQLVDSLAEKMDAVVYVHATTPTRPLGGAER
jgi:erythromycin esterase